MCEKKDVNKFLTAEQIDASLQQLTQMFTSFEPKPERRYSGLVPRVRI